MGRKNKPQSLKNLEGTTRKDRDEGKLDVESKKPEPPEWLSKVASKYFYKLADKLVSLQVVTDLDEESLGLICQEYADYLWCREVLNKKGLTVLENTDRGSKVLKKRPEVEIANSKYKHVIGKLSEFGLTPAGREKIQGKEEENDDPIDRLLKN